LVQLLEDVSTYLSDLATKKLSAPKTKDEQDRQKGLQMRNAAMVTHTKRKLSMGIDSDDDDNSAPLPVSEDDATGKKAGKGKGRGRVGASQLLTYLSEKQQDSMQIKKRKLDMEERKIELEEKRLKLEKEKWDFMIQKH